MAQASSNQASSNQASNNAFLQSVHKQAYLAGSFQTVAKTFAIRNPYDGGVVAEIADCGETEARTALEASVAAFANWKRKTGFERAQLLHRWAELVLSHQEELGLAMSLEMGKPITESRGEAVYTATAIAWYAEEAARVAGELVPSRYGNKRAFAVPEPVGPVYGITPWNFPAAMIARKVAPALAAGCTFILKPAEQTPLTALLLAKLWEQTGAPDSIFQVLPCQDPVPLSNVLMQDERIRKLTFTGSTEVGRLLYGQSAKTLKRVSLELGGHAPFIVFDDADIDLAAQTVVASKYRNAGQQCVATNRVYVTEQHRDALAEAIARHAGKLKMGDPLQHDTGLGPLVDAATLEKVKSHVADAVQKGARVVSGGNATGGLFFEATVLLGVQPGMKILEEETFGPVAPIQVFETEEQAIAMANNTPYGLAAYIWTRDLGRAWRVAEALEYGIVGVNDGVPSAMAPQAPFGGVKNSGVGREGGRWGLEAFQEVKYISMTLP